MSLPTNFFIGRGAAASFYTQLDITINATRSGSGNDTAEGGSLAQYQNAATGNNDPTTTIIGRLGSGILVVPAAAGVYDITGRAAQGSGNNHTEGRSITAGTLTLSSDVTLLISIGNNGTGNYSGGGGTFIATVNSEENPTHTDMTAADAVLVLGGGSGGYSQNVSHQVPGVLTTSLSTAQTRLGIASATDYDAGAGFLNSYIPQGESYSSSTRPQHFVQGGKGATAGGCGNGTGGFGGGGGSCPAGGGGYVGGYKGNNSPSQSGGGGGTSYCNSAYMSAFTGAGGSFDNNNYTNLNSNASGFLTITPQ